MRRVLANSISRSSFERRIETRLAVSRPAPGMESPAGTLLDLSSSGLAMEAPSVCRYARGELHRITLQVAAGSVELDGWVRWTRSSWSHNGQKGGNTYVQTAGLEFSDRMSQDSHDILRILRGMIENQNVAVEVRNVEMIESGASGASTAVDRRKV